MYRTIDTELWRDGKVKALEPEVKLLWLYLLTNEHTHLSGLYYLPIPYIAHETGLPDKGVKRGLEALEKAGMVQYDPSVEAVWVCKMLRRQKGVNAENRNAWKSILTQLESFRSSSLIEEFLNEYKDLDIPFQAPVKPLQGGLVIDTVIDTVKVIGIKGGVGGNSEAELKETFTLSPEVKRRGRPPTSGQPNYSDAFQTFWGKYPIKGRARSGKGEAWETWQKIKGDEIAEKIMAGLTDYLGSQLWFKDEGSYVPSTNRWLKRRSWEVRS